MSVVVLSSPPTSATEQVKTASVSITSIPVPKDAAATGFKLIKVKKPDGTIVTVKRKVTATSTRPEVPAKTASAPVVASGDQLATLPTHPTEPTPTKAESPEAIESPTTASAETTKVQATNNESQAPEILSAKPDKHKISFSWLGKKVLGKFNATSSASKNQAVASENGIEGKLEEGAATVGLAVAGGIGAHEYQSVLHTIEHEATTVLHHDMSKNKSDYNSNPSHERNNNDDYNQTNTAGYSGNANNAEQYDDWNADDEEVDPSNFAGEITETEGLYVDASGPAADSLAQGDNNDDIEDFNPDTDELCDNEVDPNSSAQVDDSEDNIEDFNPDTDEVFDEENNDGNNVTADASDDTVDEDDEGDDLSDDSD